MKYTRQKVSTKEILKIYFILKSEISRIIKTAKLGETEGKQPIRELVYFTLCDKTRGVKFNA